MVFRKRLTSALVLIFLFLVGAPPAVSHPAASEDAPQAKDVIEKMIHRLRGHVNVADYQMTVQRPSWTRTLAMKVWDDRTHSRVFVRITDPAKEAGTSFLRLGYNLWSYLPSVEKVMKIPPSMMLQPWMGSDFTNDDLVKESSYIDDYDHVITATEEEGGQRILKVELMPKPNAPVVWGKVIFWIREKDDIPTRQQFLDEKGRVIKDLSFQDLKMMDGVLLPTRWEMSPVLKEGQKTTLLLNAIDFDPVPPVPDSVFTEKNLKP
jgi:outer membrane lipoprotein-sorting protein